MKIVNNNNLTNTKKTKHTIKASKFVINKQTEEKLRAENAAQTDGMEKIMAAPILF